MHKDSSSAENITLGVRWSTLKSLQQMEYNFPDSSMTLTGIRFSDTLAGQTGVSY